MTKKQFDLLEPVAHCPGRQVEASCRGRHILGSLGIGLERLDKLAAEPFVGEQRAELASHRGVREGHGWREANARVQAAPGSGIQPRSPSRWAVRVASAEIGVCRSERTNTLDRPRTDSHPCLGGRRRSGPGQAKTLVKNGRQAGQPGPVLTSEDRDAAHERQYSWQPNSCAYSLGARGGRSEQVAYSSERAFRVPPGRCRRSGRSGIGSVSRIWAIATTWYVPLWVQAVAHRHAAQSGVADGVIAGHAEELLESASTSLNVAGEDVTFGESGSRR